MLRPIPSKFIHGKRIEAFDAFNTRHSNQFF